MNHDEEKYLLLDNILIQSSVIYAYMYIFPQQYLCKL